MRQPHRPRCVRSIPRLAPTAASRTARSAGPRSPLTATGAPSARHVRGNAGAARSFPSLLLFGPSPLGPHLGEPLHVNGSFVAFVLGRQALQQLYRVNDIVLNRALRGLEINVPDFGQHSLCIRRRRPLSDRFQRYEAEWFVRQPVLLFLRKSARMSLSSRVFKTASGVSQARRATWMPHRTFPSAMTECASVEITSMAP